MMLDAMLNFALFVVHSWSIWLVVGFAWWMVGGFVWWLLVGFAGWLIGGMRVKGAMIREGSMTCLPLRPSILATSQQGALCIY